ncbi:MAG: serpin family protein, partial [Candidatus Electrothrix sp. AR1]|nr:serpin family protein [Candidatus Electrothrix sp. AR1]
AREIINRWVEDKTKGKIKDLIRQGNLNYLTTLVLVNAIYFKGKWASPFDPKDTDESDVFCPSEYREVQVSMMYQKGKFGYAEIKGAQLLELPYMGKQLSMVIILPEKVVGLPEIENRLTEKNLEAWLSRLSQQDVKVYLPKFNVTWGTFDLMRPLQASGMRKAFNLKRANFSGIDGTKNLFISSVFHKTFIEVNEEGTEAAAATAVVEDWGALYAEPALFTLFEADHPFLFLIRDNVTKSILFLGRVVDPSKDQG